VENIKEATEYLKDEVGKLGIK